MEAFGQGGLMCESALIMQCPLQWDGSRRSDIGLDRVGDKMRRFDPVRLISVVIIIAIIMWALFAILKY